MNVRKFWIELLSYCTIALFSTIAIFLLPAFSQNSDRLDETLQQCQELEGEAKLAACDRAIELDENNYTAWFQRGRAFLNLRQAEAANRTFEKVEELLERSQQRFLQEVINNVEMPYRRRAYEIYANFARQRIEIGANQCYGQILSQFQQIQSLLQDETRIQQLDNAIASGSISGERLEQFQRIRAQINQLQQNPDRLDIQLNEAVMKCQERADEAIQRIDSNLPNTLDSLEDLEQDSSEDP